MGTGIYACYNILLKSAAKNQARLLGIAIINQELETVRNMPYDSIGILSGVPAGLIPANKTVAENNILYTVNFSVRNIDDSYDGKLGGTPNDLSPADYKKVEITVTCADCPTDPPITLSTNIARKGVEMASNNGALFIHVLDASGNPVPQALVRIVNNSAVPAIDFTDQTDNDGQLAVIDVPPGVETYEITVSKASYTGARTYARTISNPLPLDVHQTVQVQSVTHKTLYIDLVSALEITTVNQACAALPSINLNIAGTKLLGQPDILKYDEDVSTNGFGYLSLLDLEWDTYTPAILSNYDLAGIIPLLPINLNPGASQEYKLVLAAHTANSLLVTVKDNSSKLPLSGATVRLSLASPSYDQTQATGRGYFLATDWSGGSGQITIGDETKYFSDNENIDAASNPGNIQLKEILGQYAQSGQLVSSTYDAGDASNFVNIRWEPLSQPLETGTDSVKFQIATNNDNATWNFVGPDNTDQTYYTSADSDISGHTGQRYFRYKLFLSTEDANYTPLVSDIGIGFTESCAPPGQVFFPGLGAYTYDLEVNLAGYQTYTDTATVNGSTQKEILMIP